MCNLYFKNSIIILFTACDAALNCKSCTTAVDACTACDTDGADPRFLMDVTLDCVYEFECINANHFWDTDAKLCKGNIDLLIHIAFFLCSL